MVDLKETVSKTIKLDLDLVEKIQAMCKESERDFSKQVRFMLTEYIRIKESK